MLIFSIVFGIASIIIGVYLFGDVALSPIGVGFEVIGIVLLVMAYEYYKRNRKWEQ